MADMTAHAESAKMNKHLIPILLLGFALACTNRTERIERTRDGNGAEIVHNRLPLAGNKESVPPFDLFEEGAIDTRDASVVAAGLTDIGLFDVDSEGNIYFAVPRGGDKAVLKFDGQGRFRIAFGRRGNGPGEVQDIGHLALTPDNEVAVTDLGNSRLILYGPEGDFRRELRIPTSFRGVRPLGDGRMLLLDQIYTPNPDVFYEDRVTLAGPDLKAIKVLDVSAVENPMSAERFKGSYHIQSWSVSKDLIFTGNQEGDYEIDVFDFKGRLVRRILKDFDPVSVPESFKTEYLKMFENPPNSAIRSKVYFPDAMPPFVSFVTDEEGRVYVLTYESGLRAEEGIIDVFAPDGAFLGKRPIGVFHDFTGMKARVGKGRFYALWENEDGYKELRIYRMTWK